MGLIDKVYEELSSSYGIDSDTGCWIVVNDLGPNSYVIIGAGGKTLYAHRVSWAHHNRMDPGEKCVCHRCDVPSCINPMHLFLATQTRNMADRDSKQRQAKGERVGTAKLKEIQVKAIREAYALGRAGYRKLAQQYGVNPATIRNVVHGKTWAYMPPKEEAVAHP